MNFILKYKLLFIGVIIGAIGGYAITLLKEPMLFEQSTFMVILLAIPIIILFVMAKMGKL